MEQIIFNQQNHIIVVEPNAYGDLEYKQRVNWSSNNHIQRERANLLFRRVEQTIYNIANDIDTGDVVYTGRNNDYICRISDGIGRILFEIVCCSNNKILIIIKDFIWDYKNSTNTWWNIVEDKTINKQNKTYKTMKQKIRLTESQLHNVIRKCINEATRDYKLPGDETITDNDVVGVDGNWKRGLRMNLDGVKNQLMIICNGGFDDMYEINKVLKRTIKDIERIENTWLPVD